MAVNKPQYKCRKDNPSFSSSLLDVIYRSIDEKQSIDNQTTNNADSNNINEVTVSQKSPTSNSFYFTSTTISSSSVATESIYGFPARPKPIRTSSYNNDKCIDIDINRKMYSQQNESTTCESKTKSRAMRLYGYLKKGNQPNSPGGRLASFLISLFSTANGRKSKMTSPCTGGLDDAIAHNNRKPSVSTSSSATSYSRSCLSKTPSSSGKLTAGMKRSVRFYPASDSQPRVRKSLHGDRSDSPVVNFGANLVVEKNRRIEQSTRNLLKNYHKKVEYVFDSIKNNVNVSVKGDRDGNGDDDDDASYSSSDLFELDHLGIDPCMQELPLYETTSVDVNRAIANGLV